MADIKWFKLATHMPDDEKMKLIDAMPQRDTVHYLWIRLLIQAAKTNANGEIFLSEDMPYTDKMLAILFSRPLASIKLALKTLSRLGMIEITSDKVIRIVNWDKHQNIEGMERVREQNRKRAENHREKKKQEKKDAKSNNEETYEDEVLEENKDLEEKDDLQKNKILDKNEALENYETSEEASINAINDDKTNTATNEAVSNNIVETGDNNCNVTKNTSNVTQNESNVTVTVQNKNKNKIEIKKEKREIDKENNISGNIKNKELVNKQELSKSNLSQSKNIKDIPLDEVENDIDLKAIEIMQYHEKITGRVGGDKFIALREALGIHGEKWVKRSIDMALERNNMPIDYAIGILKNWGRDGYPRDEMGVNKNGFRSTGKNNTEDKNRFAGFKPKEPRRLTEAERKAVEATLI